MKYIILDRFGEDVLANTDTAINGKEAYKAVLEELKIAGIIDIEKLELPYHLKELDIIITAI